MCHIFFLSFLSIFLFMNTGQTAAADPRTPTVSAETLKRDALAKKNALKRKALAEKKEKMRAQPDIFTHAQWAHKQGITGKGETAIVIEIDFPHRMKELDGDKITIINPYSPNARNTPKSPKDKNHTDSVMQDLLMIAKGAHLVSLDDWLTEHYDLSLLQEGQLKRLRDACVINRSLSFDQLEKDYSFYQERINEYRRINDSTLAYAEAFKFLLNYGNEKLLVQAAGNEPISLSDPIEKNASFKLYSGHKTLSEREDIYKHLIIAGAIGQRFRQTGFSAYPGKLKRLQDITLYALGQDIKLRGYPELIRGTSLAAPTISGAILLLKQKFPTLTIFQIKEALLESADRTFVLEDRYNLKKAVFVYESDTEKPNLDHFKGQEHISSIEFNPEIYGKGILNLRAAFLYAELKVRSLKLKGPPLSPTQLRTKMKILMRKDKIIAATKIKVTFKEHLLRKKQKSYMTKVHSEFKNHFLRKKQNKAATKIQALVRGHHVRKKKILERLREERKAKPERFLKSRIGPKPAVPPKPKALKPTPSKKPSVRDIIERFGKR
jgi:hypothetical protein